MIPEQTGLYSPPTLSPIIVLVENGGIWKVTVLLEIHPFFTEPWLWNEV